MALQKMTHPEFTEKLVELFDRQMDEPPSPWAVSEKLLEKITPSGEMKPFYGATTVIMLSRKDNEACLAVRDRLFGEHGDLLVALDPDTYHLTIHALSNVYNVANDNELIKRSIQDTEPKVEAEFRRIAERYQGRTIRMRALGVSTGGKDIIGLKFVPCSEEDSLLLTDLFERMEAVYPLGERYVPHVSLGYHQIREHSPEEVRGLYDTLRRINRELELTIELEVAELVYQHHYHMNDFRDVFAVKEFIRNG
ncbi:hypothetical protein [Cohnella thailandensis]|uniref:DUF1868 domain-containing protein n=1 Tax=Cohnella thailandensis TaxID=557557 RepID=A0A841SL01_9BACL|nr:hypothetical protein [Cohnella thailandensis]MBB6633183.1 hypothetical protein [Cohnella thailandensis]MBP1975120.1 hypothetical protein [Cohnella thailandensis]